jgi:hypothetical protein
VTNKLFLSGPFGSGKSALALARIRWLLKQERIRGDEIIVLTPQRSLGRPYHEALRTGNMPPGAPPLVTTVASLARNAVELYWPLIAREAGFAHPEREPTFLTLETSQHHMGRFVDEAMERGDFDGVRVVRNRIISQVLDNMNKAALNRYAIDQVYQRLELAVPLSEQRAARLNALDAAKKISHQFRALCLEETLLDFSLQIQLFNEQVLVNPWSRTHLFRAHRHLLFDNLEEDTATAHELVRAWLPHLESALLISDEDAGFRVFLGANPHGAEMLADWLTEEGGQRQRVTGSYVMSPSVDALQWAIDRELSRGPRPDRPPRPQANPLDALVIPKQEFRFYPQMIDWVVAQVSSLVNDEGVPPGEIALLAPFVSDALRFSLETKLKETGVALTTHRPSRALEDEPSARALITLAALAHPDWGMRPAPADVSQTLGLSIDGLDPVRSHLLGRIVYPPRRRTIDLGSFGGLVPAMQERIGYRTGEAYDRLRGWLYDYRGGGEIQPLDQFFARLFGEVLSQPGYGFHHRLDAARVANQLVESARKFRWALESAAGAEASPIQVGRAYVNLFEAGALSALYVPGWREPQDAVFLSPAYTFLMRNRAARIQFWLDIGSSGWWERLYQPLTHPYVLSPQWPQHEPWDDFHEYQTRQDAIRRLLLGLTRRARERIYVAMSSYSESGFEQEGPLLNLVNRLLTKYRGEDYLAILDELEEQQEARIAQTRDEEWRRDPSTATPWEEVKAQLIENGLIDE